MRSFIAIGLLSSLLFVLAALINSSVVADGPVVGWGDNSLGQANYELWETDFGESIDSGSEANLVLKPTTLLFDLLGLASVPLRMWHRCTGRWCFFDSLNS
jgi:hypothetical protein